MLHEQFQVHFPIRHGLDEATRILIRRNHIWRDAVWAFSRPSFNPRVSVHITFVGEEAVDDGGPRREFFTQALQEMAKDGNILQGPENSRFFVHNVQVLASRKFFCAGILVAVSLANGGPGLPCLAEAVFAYIGNGIQGAIHPDLRLIPDEEIRERLEAVSLCQPIATI